MRLKEYAPRLQIELGGKYQVMETNEEKLLIWQGSTLVADLVWSDHVPMALECTIASRQVEQLVHRMYSLEEENLVEIGKRMKKNLEFERNEEA